VGISDLVSQLHQDITYHLVYRQEVVLPWEIAAGSLKGKCALGPFLVVLVIKCSTHYYELITPHMSMSTCVCNAN
jgi:hypothetical protein